MGLFDKLFKKTDEPTTPVESKPQQNLTPCKTLEELLERYGGIAFDKQLDFADVIGNNNWNVDMAKGQIEFGPDLSFPIQVLGTISHSSETWLWAWANTQSGLPENIIKQSLELKKYGEANEIDILRESSFDFGRDDLHLIGIIASGMFNSTAYYIADYGQGAMVVTLKSDKIDNAHADNHHRILTVFPQLISQFQMNHKSAFKNYLQAKGYSTNEQKNKLIGTKGANTITAEFDDTFRLTKLNG
jgi:hypothetical protein